ncbi:hypothetical protein M8320_15145 [Leclercia sp. H6W5]|uniref:hypothetical protein n=1 Tax=Leclercia tamurae TaxID=2926467 RepID=UPI0021CECB62|nr:hypothetical protein [Leclercia tamurae]MCU6683328.1 hypothetical protein [Leclercia tamurae]
MNAYQVMNLKKIMVNFDRDFSLSEQLYDRHVELIEATNSAGMDESFNRALIRMGVRADVLRVAQESEEFEELMDTFKRELTGVIARMDLADKIDSGRDAA